MERKAKMRPFMRRPVAHRGFHDNDGPAPENTLPAFRLAMEHGYGIEMDVQLSKDGRLVVVHDSDLKRVAGIEKKICDMTYDEMRQYSIFLSTETVPLFQDVLRLIGGRVPIIVEIKSDGDYLKTSKMAAEQLDSYRGVYCVESFHPRVVNWFRKNRPQVIRGQLSSHFNAEKDPHCFLGNVLLARMVFNGITKPDFIAYHYKYHAMPWVRRNRLKGRCVMAAWTIQNQKDYDEAKKHFDVIIFDSFIPKE